MAEISTIHSCHIPKNVTSPPFLGGEFKTHGLTFLSLCCISRQLLLMRHFQPMYYTNVSQFQNELELFHSTCQDLQKCMLKPLTCQSNSLGEFNLPEKIAPVLFSGQLAWVISLRKVRGKWSIYMRTFTVLAQSQAICPGKCPRVFWP